MRQVECGVFPGIDEVFAELIILAPGGVPAVAAIFAAVLAILNGFASTKPIVTGKATVKQSLVGVRPLMSTPTTVPASNVDSGGIVGTRIKMGDGRYAIVNGDGTFTFDDGSIIKCDGTIVKPADPVPVPVPDPTTAPGYTEVGSDNMPDNYVPWSAPGFTVMPPFNKIKSGETVNLQVYVGMNKDKKTYPALQVLWGDGTALQVVPVVNGLATASHSYTYVKGAAKYSGRSFYPTFIVIENDGTVTNFNTVRKCCEVEVQSI